MGSKMTDEFDITDVMDNDYQVTGNIFFKDKNILQKSIIGQFQLIGKAKLNANLDVINNWENKEYTWIKLINDYADYIIKGSLGIHGRGLKAYTDLWKKQSKKLFGKKEKEKLEYD